MLVTVALVVRAPGQDAAGEPESAQVEQRSVEPRLRAAATGPDSLKRPGVRALKVVVTIIRVSLACSIGNLDLVQESSLQ